MNRRVFTIPFPCECPYLTPELECHHYQSKTGICTGCVHRRDGDPNAKCPDPCQFPNDCPLEELPDDEMRRGELQRSIRSHPHNIDMESME